MRKKYIIYIGAAMLYAPLQMSGQQVLSPRTAISMSQLQRQNATSRVARAEKPVDKSGATTAVTAYVTINPDVTAWSDLGIKPMATVGNTATVRLTAEQIERLSQQPGVSYIQLTAAPAQMLDKARQETGVDAIHDGTTLSKPFTGKGVVVGIVDAGFDYTHSAFRNPSDGTLRIRRVWEQKGSQQLEGAKAPDKYGYGIELNTPELIAASQGDTDANSHGTHVAGIATGSDDYKEGAYEGVAPDADIVLVALDLDNCSSADIGNAVQYVFDYADEVGRPCVVNLSLGNHEGPHDGTSTFDQLADRLQGSGRLIVGAAGNHRTDKFHIDHTFASASDQPLRTFVKYKVGPSTSKTGGTVEIWGEKGTEFTVDIAAYNTFSHKDASSTTVYPAEGVTEATFDRYASGSWLIASEVSPLNGKPHVVLTSALTNLRVNHSIALTITPKGAGRVNVWADNTYLGLESQDQEGFSAPDALSSTLAEIGGTAQRILSVASYTTRNEYTTNTTSGTLEETLGDISSFSSYGPTADGRMKPEVAAPGCFIISALSTNDASGTQMYADWYDKFDRTNIYGYMQGTSMSSPFVAGVVAMWLEAYPQLSPEELKQIVEKTSRRDSFTASAPDSNWGYGKINPLGGLEECLQLAASGCETIDMPFCGEVSVRGGSVVISLPQAASFSVSLESLSGQQLLSRRYSCHAGDTVSVALPQLPSGVYLLSVGNRKFKVRI